MRASPFNFKETAMRNTHLHDPPFRAKRGLIFVNFASFTGTTVQDNAGHRIITNGMKQ